MQNPSESSVPRIAPTFCAEKIPTARADPTFFCELVLACCPGTRYFILALTAQFP